MIITKVCYLSNLLLTRLPNIIIVSIFVYLYEMTFSGTIELTSEIVKNTVQEFPVKRGMKDTCSKDSKVR